jgi:hypothetical protein
MKVTKADKRRKHVAIGKLVMHVLFNTHGSSHGYSAIRARKLERIGGDGWFFNDITGAQLNALDIIADLLQEK